MNGVLNKQHFFFIGVGGAGMSAIAQYLSGIGKTVKGSDRLFASSENDYIKAQLEQEGIACFIQDGSGIDETTEAIIISTAIEDTNVEIIKAKELGIPVIIRAELLSQICSSKRTVAIAGTSGKSTTTAMLFHILLESGISPSFITGAGLVSLQQQGKIGNAYCGNSDWLLIEADESDGTLVKYKPEVGLLLSIDKDHKELDELEDIFSTFQENTQKHFIVNQSHKLASQFSVDQKLDFGKGTRFDGYDFVQEGFSISFKVNNAEGNPVLVTIPTIGIHNMENALACMAVADVIGVSVEQCASALVSYPGIYRRHQLLLNKHDIVVIDDYAHNPAKIAASIRACQPVGKRLIAWFQPHGFGPTRFIRKELVQEIRLALRFDDEFWMSEIYYAGGTAQKDISANDIVQDLLALQIRARFVGNRNLLVNELRKILQPGDVVLLMGARDPGLEKFAKEVAEQLNTALSS